jgi:hypothetical protein
MGIKPRLRWRLFSSDSMMPSPPPCDGLAPSNNAGIHIINTAIIAAGMPLGINGKGKIIVLSNDTINTTVGGIVVLLPSYTTSRGGHDTSDKPYTAVGSSAEHRPLVECTSPSHGLNGHSTCAASSHKLGKLGTCVHLPNPPHQSTGAVQVVGTRAHG